MTGNALPAFDAVILIGGTGERLGGTAKAGVDIGGTTLFERALSATEGAGRTICVGPDTPTSRPVVWERERPAGGGPVAGVAAGLQQATAEVVVVLAVDHPFVTRDLVEKLAAGAAPAAWLVDEEARPQPLVAAYRTALLRSRLSQIGDPNGASMGRLIEGMSHVTIEDARASRDCDTWADVEWARSHASTQG